MGKSTAKFIYSLPANSMLWIVVTYANYFESSI